MAAPRKGNNKKRLSWTDFHFLNDFATAVFQQNRYAGHFKDLTKQQRLNVAAALGMASGIKIGPRRAEQLRIMWYRVPILKEMLTKLQAGEEFDESIMQKQTTLQQEQYGESGQNSQYISIRNDPMNETIVFNGLDHSPALPQVRCCTGFSLVEARSYNEFGDSMNINVETQLSYFHIHGFDSSTHLDNSGEDGRFASNYGALEYVNEDVSASRDVITINSDTDDEVETI